ncbi:MAG: alkaline shock response membrane anchor protein AmaP [Halanaerobium sp.]
MKIIKNIFSFIIALLVIILTITLSIYSLGLMSADYLPDLIRSTYNNWELAAVYLLIFIMSVFLLYPYFMEKKMKSTNLLKSESGDITITIDALSNLIKDRIKERQKFEDIRIKLNETEKGLKIILSGKLTVPGDLPAISENIQKDLKSYINQTTGIQVAKVQIQIEGVKKDENLPDKTE